MKNKKFQRHEGTSFHEDCADCAKSHSHTAQIVVVTERSYHQDGVTETDKIIAVCTICLEKEEV